jgi:hypothetical protein
MVEPPILPLSAGTHSPPVGPTPGPVPCLGSVVSPLRGPHLRSPPGRAGVVGLHRLRGRRYRPLRPASPSRCGSTSASPRCPRRRPRDRHRRSLRHASPSWLPPPGFAPPPPPSSPVISPSAAPPVAQSPPGTPTPQTQPPAARVETPVYHPPLLHRDLRHVRPMVTRHAAGTLTPRVLAATTGDSQVSPVPSSVRAALLDPHWRWRRSTRRSSPTRRGIWCPVRPAPTSSPKWI